MLEPIRHAFEAVAVEPKGDDPADDGHAGGDGPVESRRHVAEKRRADNGDEAVKRIPVEQCASDAVGHDFRAPNDRREVEQDLHCVGDDLGDVAEPGADDRDDHHHPKEVEDDQDETRDGQKGHGRDRTPEHEKDQGNNKEVVTEDDEVLPHDPGDMDPERHFDLENDTAGIGEGRAAFVDRSRHEAPHDQPDREVRQKLSQGLAEERAEDQTQRTDHNRDIDREPEGADTGPPVARSHILPAQRADEVKLPQRFPDVFPCLVNSRAYRNCGVELRRVRRECV